MLSPTDKANGSPNGPRCQGIATPPGGQRDSRSRRTG
jgi:hypothetical protein